MSLVIGPSTVKTMKSMRKHSTWHSKKLLRRLLWTQENLLKLQIWTSELQDNNLHSNLKILDQHYQTSVHFRELKELLAQNQLVILELNRDSWGSKVIRVQDPAQDSMKTRSRPWLKFVSKLLQKSQLNWWSKVKNVLKHNAQRLKDLQTNLYRCQWCPEFWIIVQTHRQTRHRNAVCETLTNHRLQWVQKPLRTGLWHHLKHKVRKI